MPEPQILGRFLSGDQAACRLVEEWVRRVIRFKGYFIPAQDHDDVVQDSLASLWRSLSGNDPPSPESFPAFVRSIAHRRCVDWIRRLRPTVELSESIEDPRASPYAPVLEGDPVARVRWLMQHVDARCRELFRLHYLEGLGFREIAQRLGTQESTQRVHMFHCTRKAREVLARWERSV